MVVDIERCQSRHIDAELLVVRNKLREFGIEAVQTFKQQHIIFLKAQRVATELAFAGLEVVSRHFHLFSFKESLHIVVEEFEVHGVEILEIVFSVFVEWSICTVHEIIVERNHLRTQELGHEVGAKTLGGSGLTARRRSCNQHDARTATFESVGNLRGNGSEFL